MATSTVTHITDDIDGSADARTVTFGFQGVGYSIDLSQKNLERLTKALSPFIERATRSRGGASTNRTATRSRARVATTSDREYDVAALRAWAGKNKLTVKGRGRIPRAVVEQYLASGGR
jgi:hypothetical protein